MRYTVVLTPEIDGSAVNVTVPAMPGVLTWGRTSEEALSSAREAIKLHLEGFVERGLPFPADRKRRRQTSGASRAISNGSQDHKRPNREVATVDVRVPAPTIRTG